MTALEAAHQIDVIISGEKLLPDMDLSGHAATRILWGLVANARHHGPRGTSQPRWVLVRDATGMGSTVASLLCTAAGFDPNEDMRRVPRDGEEEE